MSFKKVSLFLLSAAFVTGCASSKMKERKEQREKVSQSSKLYCEFINGEAFPDVDVALNLEMAKHCDSEKPFSLTNYKTPSENPGVLYCCSTLQKGAMASSANAPKKSEPKKDEPKKDDSKDDVIE